MPQIQPGQVPAGIKDVPKIYGGETPAETIPFQEKLFKKFKPHQFVTIKNIDDEPIFWQYLPEEKEKEVYSDDGMQRQVYREKPEQWYLGAGETDVLVGANAYRALDVMYKAVAAKSTLKKYRDPNSPLFDKDGQHLPKNFNYSDVGVQDDVISKAYLGPATPVFGGYEQQLPQTEQMDQFPTAAAQQQPQAQVTATPAFNDLPANANPMVADPSLVAQSAQTPDPTIPKPKTSEGAPLAPVTYASPDLEDTATPTNDGKAKVVKANEPANTNS